MTFRFVLFCSLLFAGVVSCKKDSATPRPEADFTAKESDNGNVTFTAVKSNVSSFVWSFGDSAKDSTNANPTHKYAQNGTYNVVLDVKGPGGVNSITYTVGVSTVKGTVTFWKSKGTRSLDVFLGSELLLTITANNASVTSCDGSGNTQPKVVKEGSYTYTAREREVLNGDSYTGTIFVKGGQCTLVQIL